MKASLAVLLIGLLVTSLAAGATAAPSLPQTQQLQMKIAKLKSQLREARKARNQFERQRNEAWDSVAIGLPAQVGSLAQSGSPILLLRAVFEPIRSNWPCGASISQGQYWWDVEVDLEKSRFDEPDLICRP